MNSFGTYTDLASGLVHIIEDYGARISTRVIACCGRVVPDTVLARADVPTCIACLGDDGPEHDWTCVVFCDAARLGTNICTTPHHCRCGRTG